MTSPTVPERIETLVAGWNKETGLNLNPRAFERELLAVASDPARYPLNCLEILAKYVKFENARASEPRFKRKLHLANMVRDFARFDSDWNLAAAWWRNARPKTAREEICQLGKEAGEVFPEPKRVSTDMLINALKSTN